MPWIRCVNKLGKRKKLLDTFGCGCFYCHRKLKVKHTSIDHYFPRCKGGSNEWDNLRPACQTCNSRKGAKLPHEWHPFAKKWFEE